MASAPPTSHTSSMPGLLGTSVATMIGVKKIPPPITALSATAWPAAVSAMSK